MRLLPEEYVKMGARLGPQGYLCDGTRMRGGALADCTYAGGEDGVLLET